MFLSSQNDFVLDWAGIVYLGYSFALSVQSF